ncbi:MAG: flagellar export protein FliJ [Capsulimonas sp.]|uniref:flagellar export protein FliJ n=1 Tax=Capsulimonas sp. TaxID=2494211 RepID=UPI003265161E
MKNFRFRLQTVLEQRERQEKAAQQSFAAADQLYRKADALLDELRDIRAAILEELCARRDDAFDPAETRMYQEYLQTVTVNIRGQEGHVLDLNIAREAFKLNMIDAAQNRQALDKVKDKAKVAHAQQAERRTQLELDELVSSRFTHRRMQE